MRYDLNDLPSETRLVGQLRGKLSGDGRMRLDPDAIPGLAAELDAEGGEGRLLCPDGSYRAELDHGLIALEGPYPPSSRDE